jgi:uncharacterized protein YjbI with pentapeptide repeats
MEAKLQSAQLGSADLQGVYLLRANLQKAFLSGAKLQGAKLHGADLAETLLWGANLQDADFRSAISGWVDLATYRLARPAGNETTFSISKGAILHGADLQGADLRGAHLEGIDLSQAKNLTLEQIRSAHINENTRLPSYLPQH